ncbi:hypothetical protein ACPUVO_00025 [Pseudocolwellia sp. HL-MZ19]|uniref:hypothetical protein n=1 Tax=Pseudocolwellia sp. HL-MZ19 TaxID=3400846 RepID=UPI003CF2347C
MESNVYATPKSDIENTSTDLAEVNVYSPTQIACGALVGGPVGLIYFLMTNFSSLNNNEGKRNTLYAGVALIIALLSILPDDFPSAPFTVVYVVIARAVAEKHQITKKAIIESEQYQFESNWKVFGISLICLIGSAVVLFVPFFILSMLGFITL